MMDELEKKIGKEWVRRIKIAVLTPIFYLFLNGTFGSYESAEKAERESPAAMNMPYVGKNYWDAMEKGVFAPKYQEEK